MADDSGTGTLDEGTDPATITLLQVRITNTLEQVSENV